MIETFADAYLQIGAVGFCLCLFGFMILNLIKSQKEQSDDLESIRADLSQMASEINNTMNISVKLIDSINSFKASLDDKLDRRHENMTETIDELSNQINYMQGRINGK